MEIIHLTRNQPYHNSLNISFALKLIKTKDVWIFNCNEACQHNLVMQNIRIGLISRIIITDMHIDNISGLPGLLSSLSLTNRLKALHIYGPVGLVKYLEFSKKYVHTNFRYVLYFHTLQTGLVIASDIYRFYTFINYLQFSAFLISKEKYGKFQLAKALDFNLLSGPMYGKLKQGDSFLLPDGFIVNSSSFSADNYTGDKITVFIGRYHSRCSIEITENSRLLHYYI